MSKTLEIIEVMGATPTLAEKYEIASPDHEETFNVNSYELDVPNSILNEDGVTRTDIPSNKYFHVEISDINGGHANISVNDDKQITEETIENDFLESVIIDGGYVRLGDWEITNIDTETKSMTFSEVGIAQLNDE